MMRDDNVAINRNAVIACLDEILMNLLELT